MLIGFIKAQKSPIQDCELVNENTFIENCPYEKGKILQVHSTHGLFQAIGYIKYKAAKNGYGIAYRGQAALYPTLRPSLFRTITRRRPMTTCLAEFKQQISMAEQEISINANKHKSKKIVPQKKDAILTDDLYKFIDLEDKSLLPPLLQHYGILAPWLDLVDNIWIALWFACHKSYKPYSVPLEEEMDHYPKALSRAIAKFSYYYLRRELDELHARERAIDDLKKRIEWKRNQMTYVSNTNGIPDSRKASFCEEISRQIVQANHTIEQMQKLPPFCYIILVRTPLLGAPETNVISKGFIENHESQLADLRICVPSYYLRPHAQHALSIYKKLDSEQPDDFSDMVEGILRIRLSEAISWIGESKTLSVGSLFPSPCYDVGLKKLLNLNTFADYLEIPTP